MCVLAPGWLEHFFYNEYYRTDEEYLFALADAIKHEYKAIVDGGFILQIDDPALPDTYDMIVPPPSIEAYRKFAAVRVEAMNHALQGIPEDRVRYHICWGSWHGPHTHDLPLKHVVDLMLKVQAGAYSVEAANPRHEHEWKGWKEVKLPRGKVLIPGEGQHAAKPSPGAFLEASPCRARASRRVPLRRERDIPYITRYTGVEPRTRS